MPVLSSADDIRRRFDDEGYLADEGMATALFLTLELGLPLLLEGEPGVGKTAAAQVLAARAGRSAGPAAVLRGADRERGALRLELPAAAVGDPAGRVAARADHRGRPLQRGVPGRAAHPALRAPPRPQPPVLLIDEVDRADDEFEALLLEALGEGSVTVPEIGTFTAEQPPIVVLTSNRSRELHDALRRRCLYHWLEFPEPTRVVAILRRTAPAASVALIESAAQFVGHVRTLDVDKPPGVAEAINWVAALSALGATELVRELVVPALGALAKTPDDRDLVIDSLDSFAFG